MKVFDLHSDFLTELIDYKSYLNAQKNVKIISAIYKGNMSFSMAKTLVEKFKNLRQNQAFLAFENVCYELENEAEILSLNPVSASLTYNGENRYGFGCDFNLPLKNDGIIFAKKLSLNGAKIDVAHLSEKGIFSLLENGIKIYSSHTAVNAIFKHKRNLSNELIGEIIKSGGIVGITPVSYFLGGNKLEDYAKHIDYVVMKFGVENACIGTDFFGTDSYAGNLEKYEDFSRLYELFMKWGYKENHIDKIFYKNAERFFNL